MHDSLFKESGQLKDENLKAYAKDIGLDVDEDCLKSLIIGRLVRNERRIVFTISSEIIYLR